VVYLIVIVRVCICYYQGDFILLLFPLSTSMRTLSAAINSGGIVRDAPFGSRDRIHHPRDSHLWRHQSERVHRLGHPALPLRAGWKWPHTGLPEGVACPRLHGGSMGPTCCGLWSFGSAPPPPFAPPTPGIGSKAGQPIYRSEVRPRPEARPHASLARDVATNFQNL
jgi:hypothetical protein